MTGVDLSKEVISQARQLSAEKGYTIPFTACDGKHLPYPDEAFDVVFCEKGKIYRPEDGTILHCLCRKQQADGGG